MMRRRSATIVLVAAAALGIAACGGGEEEEEAPAPAGTAPPAKRAAVNVEMSEFKFTPASITVDRGGTLDVSNAGAIAHNLTIERRPDAETDTEDLAATSTFGKGESEQLEVDIERGTYVLVCTVAGHRAAGMVGKITVR